MKVVFLDRDGTLIVEPPDEQVDSLEKLELIPGVIQGLQMLQRRGYVLVMVTNQDNLGTSLYPQEKYDVVMKKLMGLFEGEGIKFDKIFVCPHNSKDNCLCRKPKIGLIEDFLKSNNVTLEKSYVIGDRNSDVEFAKNIGCKSIQLTKDSSSTADYFSDSFLDVCKYIVRKDRSARECYRTDETKVEVEVTLDGKGDYDISSGIGFFDHMLAQLSKHSGIDMKISVSGDINVDEHHTIEDTGITLGKAILSALGDKHGIERYGFLLPMDESLAQVALDLGGRPHCSFKASFKREKVGEMPTELVEDFFCAFAYGLRANLHISATGRNDHHKIEAIFKSVARALRQAIRYCEQDLDVIPSTKGII